MALEEKEKELDDALKAIVEQNDDFKKVWLNQSEHYWNQCWGKIIAIFFKSSSMMMMVIF